MVHLLLASHGQMAEAMVESVAMLYGRSVNIQAIGLYEEDCIEQFHERLLNVICEKEEVLILVDIPGGSPSNRALILAQEHPHIQVVSGMNLMMVLECMIHMEHASMNELVDMAISSSIKSIQKVFLKSLEKDNLDTLLE